MQTQPGYEILWVRVCGERDDVMTEPLTQEEEEEQEERRRPYPHAVPAVSPSHIYGMLTFLWLFPLTGTCLKMLHFGIPCIALLFLSLLLSLLFRKHLPGGKAF